MQVLRGIARNVREVAVKPDEKAMCLELDGRSVQIPGREEEPLAVRDGDQILVSGWEIGDNVLKTSTYKNFTRGYVKRVGGFEDAFVPTWGFLVGVAIVIWGVQNPGDPSMPYYFPLCVRLAIGIPSAVVLGIAPVLYVGVVLSNCTAELWLMRASIEVVRGTVRWIEQSTEWDQERNLTLHHVRMDVDGHAVKFASFSEVPISEGEEVVVAGAGDFTGINVIYRNITRSLRSADRSAWRLGWRIGSSIGWGAILIVGIVLLWSWGYPGKLNMEFAMRRVFALGLMLSVARSVIRFAFQCRFLPELARLVRDSHGQTSKGR
jgi:hypothetical protein